MEYVNGKEIHDYIKNNPQNLNEIFNQTIEGFKYLEQINVLHRDIRPQNILVSNDGIVKIIDFGFGKKIEFNENFDKSISLNWRFSPPSEFITKIYDFKTELYFVGKLFEELIIENQIENFAFPEILNKMITINYTERIDSFFEISRNLLNLNSSSLQFTEEEILHYQDFAESITALIGSIYSDAEYIQDIDFVLLKLKEIYQNSILESYIFNNDKILNCFIKGGFRYFPRNSFQTYILRNFLDLTIRQSTEKKKIIFNHLWNRFDSFNRIENTKLDDDIPF